MSMAQGLKSSAGWCNYESGVGCSTGATTTFTGTNIAGTPVYCSSNCVTVSGTVTIPSTVTPVSGAPLYVGIYQNSPSGNGPSAIYAEEIQPASVNYTTSGNSYSLTIPNNSSTPTQGYVLFGILDQNNDGMIDAGDVTNANHNNSNGFVTASNATTATENLPACTTSNDGTCMPNVNSSAITVTDYVSNTCDGCGSTYTNYQLGFDVSQGNKLPVAVTLLSESLGNAGAGFATPIDLGLCNGCGNGSDWQYQAFIPGGTPTTSDVYTFQVTYSDSPTDTQTITTSPTNFGSTGAIVGPNDLPTALSPGSSITNAGDAPTFTWTWPANTLTSNTYYYQFYRASVQLLWQLHHLGDTEQQRQLQQQRLYLRRGSSFRLLGRRRRELNHRLPHMGHRSIRFGQFAVANPADYKPRNRL